MNVFAKPAKLLSGQFSREGRSQTWRSRPPSWGRERVLYLYQAYRSAEHRQAAGTRGIRYRVNRRQMHRVQIADERPFGLALPTSSDEAPPTSQVA